MLRDGVFLDFLFALFASTRFLQIHGNKRDKIPVDESDNWLVQVINISLNIWWLHVSAFHQDQQ